MIGLGSQSSGHPSSRGNTAGGHCLLFYSYSLSKSGNAGNYFLTVGPQVLCHNVAVVISLLWNLLLSTEAQGKPRLHAVNPLPSSVSQASGFAVCLFYSSNYAPGYGKTFLFKTD